MSAVLDERRAAARAGAALVERGMRVGLGSGRTVALLIRELGRRARGGLRFRCVAASRASAALARAQGLTLEDLGPRGLDLALDGADEVDPRRRLLKGGGGALTRERVVLAAAPRRVIVVDEGKLVPHLGHRARLPIEVLRFGAARTQRLVADLLGKAAFRRRGRGLYVTDNGGLLLDCPLAPRRDLDGLQRALDQLPGVIDCGLFLDLDPEVIVGEDAA
jgi:ribose 5-phosphate isomerase A